MLQKNTIPLHRKNDKVAKTFQKIKKNQKRFGKKNECCKKNQFLSSKKYNTNEKCQKNALQHISTLSKMLQNDPSPLIEKNQ